MTAIPAVSCLVATLAVMFFPIPEYTPEEVHQTVEQLHLEKEAALLKK
jgi:Na+/melibiose symporter-like transporter